jgi:hypothetical protein
MKWWEWLLVAVAAAVLGVVLYLSRDSDLCEYAHVPMEVPAPCLDRH